MCKSVIFSISASLPELCERLVLSAVDSIQAVGHDVLVHVLDTLRSIDYLEQTIEMTSCLFLSI